MNSEVMLAFIAFMGAVTAGFFKMIADQNKNHARLAKSMDKVASSNEKIAKETKRSADEAKQRNGHLAELTIESKKQIIDIVSTVKHQHVVEQTVDQSTVKDEVVQHEVVKAKK